MVMENWRRWFWGHTDKYVVKVSQLRLQFGEANVGVDANDEIAIQIMGIAMKKQKASSSYSYSSTSKTSLPFHATQKLGSTHTHTTFPQRFLNSMTPTLVWDARDLHDFNLILKHVSEIGTCHMTFHVLYGEGDVVEYKPEMVVVGEVSLSVTMTELMVGEEMKNVQRTLPIQLKVHGLFMEATLSVSLSLLKLGNYHDDLPRTFVDKVISLVEVDQVEEPSSYESDELAEFDSDDSSDESTTTTSSDSSSNSIVIHNAESRVTNGSERFMDSETETLLDTMQRSWSMLPWSRSFKGWSFKRTTSRKQEPLNSHLSHCMEPHFDHKNCSSNGWENRELWSRDAQTRVKTKVFFASFDQRSKEACGESACTSLVVFIAHWLHSNHNMPSKEQFDNLIKRGSSEWKRLSHIDHYLKLFPDKHFDLDTILEANIRPLVVLPRNSYTGFFSPEKFQCLEGAMSFDDIWDEITRDDVVDHEPRVYIVSWNDHFFVLKVEVDACYIIDTLGERIFEGCQKAFIMKFDDSSLMHEKGGSSKEESVEIVCNGRECCKEFIKRFLAAIPLRQLEEEQNKGTDYNLYFHKKLQIDFHYSLLSSMPSASSSIGEPLKSHFI
ncbi:uncharacterized protein LOC109811085 [Cajanus cajan]|uniref:uncharacterized protein LOC109811085 n=1 Tax=Cajanus cajan TaxID=3821 RepID=UPI00098DD53F|nr:uncharacterized protein LOC109811085 [Cajanus cajan]